MVALTLTLDSNTGVGTITFVKAAYDRAFMEELDGAIDEVANQPEDIRALVVTSEVPRIFCAGADLDAFMAQDPAARHEMAQFANSVLNKFGKLPQIVIAAINGHCLGGGLETAMACDLRLLAEKNSNDDTIRIGLVESNLGLIPGTGGTQRLPRLIGQGRAMDYILHGALITPDEALAWGLVNRVFEGTEALSEGVAEYAVALAMRAPRANTAIKRAVLDGAGLSLEEGLRIEADYLSEIFRTADAEEGMKAFKEKRPPVWTGK